METIDRKTVASELAKAIFDLTDQDHDSMYRIGKVEMRLRKLYYMVNEPDLSITEILEKVDQVINCK